MHDDIIGIMNSNGNKLVSYTYDSWGNIISIKDNNNQEISQEDYTNIANINLFRYRSYYYDVETRLYYLNHRYYNPRINRFISPDVILGSNQDILAYNLYTYVGSNPINSEDKNGKKKAKSTSKKKSKKKKKKNSSLGSVLQGAANALSKSVNNTITNNTATNSSNYSRDIKTIAEYSAEFNEIIWRNRN